MFVKYIREIKLYLIIDKVLSTLCVLDKALSTTDEYGHNYL